VHDFGWDPDVLSGADAQLLASAPDEEDAAVDDESLLLVEVDVRGPPVSPLGGLDVRPSDLGVTPSGIASGAESESSCGNLLGTHPRVREDGRAADVCARFLEPARVKVGRHRVLLSS
jgi:hypothetical protein